MPSQRIKGQEVTILVTRDGALEAELTDITQCEFSYQFEKKSDGYLGEKTNRHDEVFMGIDGNLTMHIHDGSVFDFIQAVKDRAQRVTPDLVFSISGIFQFPNGEVRTLSVDDAKFGAVPISTNSRGDYVEVKFDFSADDARVQRD